MKITTLASGSTGNCYHITDGANGFLIEAGIPIAEIKRRLNFRLSKVSACLISHEHGDHAQAIKGILAAGIPVITSQGTADATGTAGHHRLRIIADGQQESAGPWLIRAFATKHDAAEPLGFLIANAATKERLLFFTDTEFIAGRFRGITHIIGECNHSAIEMKRAQAEGRLPFAAAPRLYQTHMSLEAFLLFLRDGIQTPETLKEIHLAHISNRTGDAEAFRQTIERATGIPVYY